MRLVYSSLLFCALLCACEQQATVEPRISLAPSPKNLEESAKRIAADVAYLANDARQGRAAGTAAFDQSADYVVQRFQALGLQPAGENGSYYQRVPMLQGLRKKDDALLLMKRGAESTSFVFEEEFLPGINYHSPKHRLTAPMVFVGQAVFAPELKHNDFVNVFLRDKIAVVFNGAPESFASTQRAFYSSRAEKLKQLSDRGAIGVLFLTSPDDELRTPWVKSKTHWAEPGMRLLDKQNRPIDTFPKIQATASVNLAATKKILENPNVPVEHIFRNLKEGKLSAFNLPGQLTLAGATETTSVESKNVVAMLKGSDVKLSKEYLAYTAHLDHLGVGVPVKNDVIYNGALDNALGVSIMIETARNASLLSPRPKRSMLFIAVTAEENGLLGADYFAKNPTVDKKSIVANINTDMPMLLTELLDIVPIGLEHSSMLAQVEKAANDIGFLISPDPAPEEVVFIRSDQFAFVKQGIPAMYIDGGVIAKDKNIDGKQLAKKFLDEHYHQPSDDIKQPIHYPTAAKMAAFNSRFGQLVADEPYAPRWNIGDFFGKKFAGQP
jgi:Zn-dependent M28 family amino/carboxypeptidase